MRARLVMPLLALLLAAASPPLPAELNDPNTTEGWIWQRVQAGLTADLNDRCGTPPLDIHQGGDARWKENCRRVDPGLLRALLTQPDLADHVPHGVRIQGAWITDNLDLHDAMVSAAEVWLSKCWIAGNVDLADARLNGSLLLEETLIEGGLGGTRTVVGSYFYMDGTVVGGTVDVSSARIDGHLIMTGADFPDKKTFWAAGLHVRGALFLDNVKFAGPVDVRDAHVDNQMLLDNSSFADKQRFNAERLYVGAGGLALRNVRFGGPVVLQDARVDGWLDMEAATVGDQQSFSAERLHVEALFLRNVSFGGPVDLVDTKVEGSMNMQGAHIAGRQGFDAEQLHVGSDFNARSVTFGGTVSLASLAVGGTLDLRDSHVSRMDLEGASIRNDLLLGGRDGDGSEHWLQWDSCDGPAPCLDLRNAKAGNLQDDKRAWPDQLTLEGFTYTHLGGFGGEQGQDMRNRPISWWRGWLDRDPVYSAQPYAQLAGVLEAAGNREGADDIRFFGRDRERAQLLRGCTWLQQLNLARQPNDDRSCRWGTGLGMTALQTFVGYGIGSYTFRAAGWALVLVLVGTIILFFAPGARGIRPSPSAAHRGPRQRSVLWCIGASLNQVLPLVTISQEFNDFFNDPKRERLLAWQQVAFGVLKLWGWALGLFVVAAFSGLIQH